MTKIDDDYDYQVDADIKGVTLSLRLENDNWTSTALMTPGTAHKLAHSLIEGADYAEKEVFGTKDPAELVEFLSGLRTFAGMDPTHSSFYCLDCKAWNTEECKPACRINNMLVKYGHPK